MTEKRMWLRGLEYGCPGAMTQVDFYTSLWGLTEVARSNDAVFFRATGPEHYILALHERPTRGIVRINLGVAERAQVEALHASLTAKGVPVLHAPRELSTPGGGYGFELLDPDRRVFRISSDVARHLDTNDAADRPRKASHIVLNTVDMDRMASFLTEALGFRVSDYSEDVMAFFRCNQDHHAIALVRADRNSVNHMAFEMPSIDAYMRGIGRMKNGGYPVNWGPGRHGPGNNPFAYYAGPSGFVIEYTAEVQQIDEATHQPQVWPRTPEKSDLWMTAGPPTRQMRTAMAGDPDPGWKG
jgi:catechol 2,3-dioxygenase-like lactoylglutathione lyase family enzyme